MFVPTFQGLSAADFVRPASGEPRVFPFDAPNALTFYRARNAIYYLFRALREMNPALTVLAPDYNSGNEILALRAAGVTIRYYSVGRDMRADPNEIHRLCEQYNPDVLYVIHYLGWPQPMRELTDLCRARDMYLVEDCALALLSQLGRRPLGTFGHWSVFCLYKTLPLPNGALLVENGEHLERLRGLRLRRAGTASVLGRTAELVVQRLRGRVDRLGKALLSMKQRAGRAATALEVKRATVGDIGFNLNDVDLAMSSISARLLRRLNFDRIRRRRVENFQLLSSALTGRAARVQPRLDEGVCPLFFPIFVQDKHAAATTLQRRGVDALEFWNDSVDGGEEMSATSRFLRAHVLELPIHQDLTAQHIEHVAHEVTRLHTLDGLGDFHRRTA